MKTLEAKPFDQNAENWKRENRPFISTVLEAGTSGQNRIGTQALRSHRPVWFVFAAQTLVRNWHCWSRKAFPRQMTPQSREKTAKTAVFRHRWQAWKVVRSIAAVRQRPRTPRNWRCSFAFFEIFLWHFNKKQRAEVIFRLSRPVSCKNQENGSGKRWSLHAPLKRLAPLYLQPTKENVFRLLSYRLRLDDWWTRHETRSNVLNISVSFSDVIHAPDHFCGVSRSAALKAEVFSPWA